MNHIRPFQDAYPQISPLAYIDPTAVIIGDIVLGDNSSVWPFAVIRADVNYIHIGKNTNVQDGSVLHVNQKTAENPKGSPLIIGDDVTVGHRVVLHGSTIQNRILIGMSSTVMNDVLIEDDVIIGAGSLIPPGKHLESGYLYLGSPAKKIRPLTDDEYAFLKHSALHYARLGDVYQAALQVEINSLS